MATHGTKNITIRLDTIDQLFKDSDTNPFSDKEVNVLGESALHLLIRRVLARGLRDWKDDRVTIQLPADQITPDLKQRTVDAIRRYAMAKIEDNNLSIRLSRVRSVIGLISVVVISLLVFAVAFFLLSGPLAGTNSVIQGLISGAACVFAWVIVWDPLERLLFDWVDPALENRILRKLQEIEIEFTPVS